MSSLKRKRSTSPSGSAAAAAPPPPPPPQSLMMSSEYARMTDNSSAHDDLERDRIAMLNDKVFTALSRPPEAYGNIDALAVLLQRIVKNSPSLNRNYLDVENATRLIEKHPDLEVLLREAVKTRNCEPVIASQLATAAAWKGELRGTSHKLLLKILDEMNSKRGRGVYTNYVAMVQSSGMSESRMMYECSKLCLGPGFNLLHDNAANGGAYPKPNKEVRDYLLLNVRAVAPRNLPSEYMLRYTALFAALFQEMKNELDTVKFKESATNLTREDVGWQWHEHLQMRSTESSDQSRRNDLYKRVVKLNLKALLGDNYESVVQNSRADNAVNSATFDETFHNSFMRFTHFVRSSHDFHPTSEHAWIMFARGAAVITSHNYPKLDVWVPVLQWEEKLNENVMTAMFLEIQNRASEVTVSFNADEEGFFVSEDGANKPRSYITLVMQLDLYRPTNNRRTINAQTSVPSTLSNVPVGQGPSRMMHGRGRHRFSIVVKGCSPSVYGVVEEQNKDAFKSLLEVRDVISEHPRPDARDAILQLKPFFGPKKASLGWVEDAKYDDDVNAGEALDPDVVLVGQGAVSQLES
ncbi:hypothetical protein DACRYDRAFT_112509 [Dacryopinax primogenitus]|uniref:Uncharacterized protein n=1 Tax=Dacryopinax primogenitus (strain DJM 731) TaxID=1858805 RepID=M5FP12_DACPD|nr:uncharacterized protein DACRYDRAFT_112509 [Dacryopinax primogenitus]EJT96703.1 hypothetical protein DACRYDRAFT_112509 [Dacryopinax primogenitus]